MPIDELVMDEYNGIGVGRGHRNGELITTINDLIAGHNDGVPDVTDPVDVYLAGTAGLDTRDGQSRRGAVQTWARVRQRVQAIHDWIVSTWAPANVQIAG